MYGFRPAGENDASGPKFTNIAGVCIPGNDFAVDADLPDPARNQLGVLRTEVQDHDAVLMNIWMHNLGPSGDISNQDSL
jgi:hypothetical protein